jgi:ABC-type uncharacterized transport system ATPase component
LAEQHQDPGTRAAAACLVDLRPGLSGAGSHRPDQALRRLPGGQPGVVRRARGRDPRPHRSERVGQEHDLQPDRRDAAPERRLDPLQGNRDRGTGGALKKLELARALATQPTLLLADESLGGLDSTETERAADLLESIRSRMGITIVWVEHIMGVLMRVVDRVIVLDHGEKIFEGLPKDAAHDPRVTEVYLGKRRT